jgi:hypothetical protein
MLADTMAMLEAGANRIGISSSGRFSRRSTSKRCFLIDIKPLHRFAVLQTRMIFVLRPLPSLT